MSQEKEQDKINDIDFYYRKNRFFNLLFVTKKYKDLYRSKEAFIAVILSIITVCLLNLTLTKEDNFISSITKLASEQKYYIASMIEPARSLLLTIAGGFFSLLGFSIGGLAILTGTIDNSTITNIRTKNKVDHLISVIFNFYFAGSSTGFSIILCLLTYSASFTQIQFNHWMFIVWCFIVSYFVFFSIIYSIMLLGTCIRLFLLKYFYAVPPDENEGEE